MFEQYSESATLSSVKILHTLIMLSLAATKRMAALLSAQVVLFSSLKPVGQAQVKEGG